MRVLIDDRPCDVTGDSVGAALAEAASRAEASGRVIVEVVVDGERWGETELSSPERSQAAADEVQLVSADRGELVCRTLGEAADVLGEIDDLQRHSAESLQVGEVSDGMTRLGEALELWLLVQRSIDMSLQTMGIDLETVKHDGERIAASVNGLEQQLRGVRDALSRHDSVALADTLLFELPEVIEHWRGVLGSVQRHVQEIRPTTPDADGSDAPDTTDGDAP
jgi:hypothetical protein